MAKLPKAKFNLRKPNANSPILISLFFRYRGQRLVYSSGHSVHPSDWDFSQQRPYEKERRNDLLFIRGQLDRLANLCRDIYIEHEYGNITVATFKERLASLTAPADTFSALTNAEQNHDDRLEFFEFIEQELGSMKQAKMKDSSLKRA